MVLTNLNIIVILLNIVKWIQKLILLDLKLSRENYAPTLSSTWTTKVIIRQIPINVPFDNIILTGNSTQKIPRTLWKQKAVNLFKHDFERYQNFLSKCSQEQLHYQHYIKNTKFLQYHFHSKTILVLYTCHTKFEE